MGEARCVSVTARHFLTYTPPSGAQLAEVQRLLRRAETVLRFVGFLVGCAPTRRGSHFIPNEHCAANFGWDRPPLTAAREAPRPSAVITAHNEEAHLANCLRSLQFADELVVLLDRCTDGSSATARDHADQVLEGRGRIRWTAG